MKNIRIFTNQINVGLNTRQEKVEVKKSNKTIKILKRLYKEGLILGYVGKSEDTLIIYLRYTYSLKKLFTLKFNYKAKKQMKVRNCNIKNVPKSVLSLNLYTTSKGLLFGDELVEQGVYSGKAVLEIKYGG